MCRFMGMDGSAALGASRTVPGRDGEFVLARDLEYFA